MQVANLFAGCGGFALGAQRAGCEVVAAFDIDDVLTSGFEHNFPRTNVVLGDVRDIDGDIVRKASGGLIDGIFGGPPCQGFSAIGRRNPLDPRRNLLGEFFRIVRELAPRFFVMENVRGLGYASARGVLDSALHSLDDRYALLGPLILNAGEFGAATARSRLFVIGIHKDSGEAITEQEICAFKRAPASVQDAMMDLQDAIYLGEEDGFDSWHIRKPEQSPDYARGLQSACGRFTGHRKAKHSDKVVARFNSIQQGKTDPVGRHPRLSWSGQCPTIRAGTGSDRGSYLAVRPIHPELPRVITVREAARLQGFPDGHLFHPTVWHSFRMIGNSVCPLVSNAIFSSIKNRLNSYTAMSGVAE